MEIATKGLHNMKIHKINCNNKICKPMHSCRPPLLPSMVDFDMPILREKSLNAANKRGNYPTKFATNYL
jgi:hypothetical protein